MNARADVTREKAAPRRQRRSLDGLLLLDKPIGMTSNGALQRVKWLFQARKAGHTGSLDPLASGLLPICFGQGTKLSGYLLGADKTYRVTACWGARTNTGDADGEVVEQDTDAQVSEAALESALVTLTGEIEQIPPMYSALKRNGKRLYELARQGQEVPREPRPVTIHELRVEDFDPVSPTLLVRCSKGTYVRTLIEDIAVAAGTVGHVAALRRERVASLDGQDMVTMAQIEQAADAGLEALDRYLLPLDVALSSWTPLALTESEAFYLRQGNPVTAPTGQQEGLVRLYGPGERFLGVGEILADGRVAPRRLFQQPGGR